MDLAHITLRAQEIIRTDKSCKLVLGQLVDKRYLNRLCEEVNDKLRLQGQITFGEITRQYDLPGDFLQGVRLYLILLFIVNAICINYKCIFI